MIARKNFLKGLLSSCVVLFGANATSHPLLHLSNISEQEPTHAPNVLPSLINEICDSAKKPVYSNVSFSVIKTKFSGPEQAYIGIGKSPVLGKKPDCYLDGTNEALRSIDMQHTSRFKPSRVLVYVAAGTALDKSNGVSGDLIELIVDGIVGRVRKRFDGHGDVMFSSTIDSTLCDDETMVAVIAMGFGAARE